MPTDPLTGSRYPASTSAPNVPQDIQNAVLDLAGNTVPRFTTTAARDSAYSAWVAAGNSLQNGRICWTDDSGWWRRISGTWKLDGDTNWVTISPNAPFTAVAGTATRYRVKGGICYISCTLTRTTAWVGPITVFTLQASAAPTSSVYLHAVKEISGNSSAAVGAVRIYGSGIVEYRFDGAANDTIGFSGSFPVD